MSQQLLSDPFVAALVTQREAALNALAMAYADAAKLRARINELEAMASEQSKPAG